MEEQIDVKVIESNDKNEFEFKLKFLLEQGYKISSSNCGFVNSENYDFCGMYQAILVKE